MHALYIHIYMVNINNNLYWLRCSLLWRPSLISTVILASFASKALIVAPLPIAVVRHGRGQLGAMNKLVTLYWSNMHTMLSASAYDRKNACKHSIMHLLTYNQIHKQYSNLDVNQWKCSRWQWSHTMMHTEQNNSIIVY